MSPVWMKVPDQEGKDPGGTSVSFAFMMIALSIALGLLSALKVYGHFMGTQPLAVWDLTMRIIMVCAWGFAFFFYSFIVLKKLFARKRDREISPPS